MPRVDGQGARQTTTLLNIFNIAGSEPLVVMLGVMFFVIIFTRGTFLKSRESKKLFTASAGLG